MLDFVFEKDRWRCKTIDESPGSLTIRNVEGNARVVRERLETSVARETLGVFLAPDFNQETQFQELLKKAKSYAESMRTCHLTRDEAWYSFESTIMKTLEYPMVTSSLSRKQWDKIMSPILCAVLPKSGIVRTMPRSLVFSPFEYLGFGLKHPFLKQHMEQVKAILEESLKKSLTDELMSGNMAYIKLELGYPGDMRNWQLQKCNPA